MARLFWVCCPKKSQFSSSCNKQISKSAYYSLCSREQCLLSGICRFLGLVFCDFLAISLRMPFKNKFAIWGLVLGLCFCRSPFLWRAIDFSFFWAGSGIFFGFLNFFCSCFSAFLLLCFSACLLFFFFSACMLFLLFRYFVFFLLFCFSAFLASLCSASLFFFLFFPASLLFYFSAFLFLLVFFCSHAFSWYFSRTKIRKPFPYFVLPLVEFELCKQL